MSQPQLPFQLDDASRPIDPTKEDDNDQGDDEEDKEKSQQKEEAPK